MLDQRQCSLPQGRENEPNRFLRAGAMTFKDILVQITDSADCTSRLALAIAIANAHGAHLTGLYVEQPLLTAMYSEFPVPAEIIDAEIADAAARAATLKRAFVDATMRAGVGAEWRQSRADSVAALTAHGRYADLVVTGHDNDPKTHAVDGTTSTHVVLESGRPVMVVPSGAMIGTVGRRVLVGWNGRRESVRAVHDALPFLTRADFVQVVAIDLHSDHGEHAVAPYTDICRHLAHHGVQPEIHVGHAEAGDIGASLLAQSLAIEADLVVVGAYGHSRLRELVLGGVTRYLMHHMMIPMLMAH